jgi:hypothetical protein
VKKLTIVFLMLTGTFFCKAQTDTKLFHDAGMYTTLYWANHEQTTVTPQVWVSLKNYYLEARYNYEDLQTFSLYFGKSFALGKRDIAEITPLIGGVAGKVNGISPAFNFSLDYLKFSIVSQTQYTFDLQHYSSSFFYDWTNFSFGIYKNLGLGGSIMTCIPQSGKTSFTAGPIINFRLKHLFLEAYSYDFGRERPLWALGIQYTL